MSESIYEFSSIEFPFGKNLDQKVDLSDLGRHVQPGHIAYFLSCILNGLGTGYSIGRQVGLLWGADTGNFHRTIQGQLVNFALGLLVGYAENSDPRWTDPRNETAVKVAHQVAKDLGDGHFHQQPFI